MVAVSLTAGALMVVPALPACAQQTVRIPARDRTLTGKPVELYSIGREEGEDWELLAGVRQVAFDASENLYVLDSGNQRVLVFDANGRFLRQIGRKGEGPGELMSPLGMTVTQNGEVIVSDLGRQAYSIFKTDGSFVRNVTPEVSDFGAFASQIYEHPAGIVSRHRPMVMMARNVEAGRPAMPTTGPEKMQVTLTDLKTAKRSTLWEITLPEQPTKVSEQSSGPSQRSFRVIRSTPEFMPPVLMGVVPGGAIAVASEADYRIRITSNGGVQRVIERPIAPRKVGRREQNLARERRRSEMSSGRTPRMAIAVRAESGGRPSVSTAAPPAMTPAQIEAELQNLTFMDYVPVLSGMVTDPLGRIWLKRTANDLGDGGPIDLITHDGRYIGSIPGLQLPVVVSRGGRAAWIERDDMGVERVVVKRLPASWR